MGGGRGCGGDGGGGARPRWLQLLCVVCLTRVVLMDDDDEKADGNSKTQNQFESPALVPNDDSMSMSASAAPLKYIGK